MHATTTAPGLTRIADTLAGALAAAHRAGRDIERTTKIVNQMSDHAPWTLTELDMLCRVLRLDLDELLDGASDGWEVLAS